MLQGFLKAHGKQAGNVLGDGRTQQRAGLLELLLYRVYTCHHAVLSISRRQWNCACASQARQSQGDLVTQCIHRGFSDAGSDTNKGNSAEPHVPSRDASTTATLPFRAQILLTNTSPAAEHRRPTAGGSIGLSRRVVRVLSGGLRFRRHCLRNCLGARFIIRCLINRIQRPVQIERAHLPEILATAFAPFGAAASKHNAAIRKAALLGDLERCIAQPAA